MTMIPDLPPTPAAPPLFHREGGAQVNYDPADELGQLTFVVDTWSHAMTCTEREWHQLVAAVSSVLAEPMAVPRRVAARVARLGEGGDRDAA